MNAFEIRKKKSDELTDYFNKFLSDNKISFFESGYEFYKSLENANDKIKKLNDNTSKFVRYYPDFTYIGKDKTILIEVKNSSGIEKECFENYKMLEDLFNLNILLLLKNKKLCKIKDIVFNKAKSYDVIAEMNVPVTNEIWKEPRLLENNEYYKYLQNYKNKKKYTSGCSFAFIDFYKTKFFELEILLKYS
jgi:hypothetical protein